MSVQEEEELDNLAAVPDSKAFLCAYEAVGFYCCHASIVAFAFSLMLICGAGRRR